VKKHGGYGKADVLVDLRVDDHPTPIEELERLYRLHQLYFSQTPDEAWLPLDADLEAEVRRRLDRLGYSEADLATGLESWAGFENLELRARGAERVDPVVLEELRMR